MDFHSYNKFFVLILSQNLHFRATAISQLDRQCCLLEGNSPQSLEMLLLKSAGCVFLDEINAYFNIALLQKHCSVTV